jgi:translation initiation factor IF-3
VSQRTFSLAFPGRFFFHQHTRRLVISNPLNTLNNSGFGGKKPSGGANNNRNKRNWGRYADQTRVNERIRAPKVRVVDGDTNAQLGVMPTHQAIRLAKDRGVDLVEVAATADPPVCRIVDYGKYKYTLEKHKKEAAKHHKASKLKELKFRVGIDPHDYLIKITHAEDFLAEGHKLRVQLQFRGRQMAHQELGHMLAERIKKDLLTMGLVDAAPRQAGRNINMQISPLPEKQRMRKIKTHLKGVTDETDAHHSTNVAPGQGPQEDHHDEDEHHEDGDHSHVGEGSETAVVEAPAAEAVVPQAPVRKKFEPNDIQPAAQS